MRTPTKRAAIFLYVVAGFAPPAVAQVDQQRAQEFFTEVQTLCERDGGRLWGVSLCAPMVIGDMRTPLSSSAFTRSPFAGSPLLRG